MSLLPQKIYDGTAVMDAPDGVREQRRDIQHRQPVTHELRIEPEGRQRIGDHEAIQHGIGHDLIGLTDENAVGGGGMDTLRALFSTGVRSSRDGAASADHIVDDDG